MLTRRIIPCMDIMNGRIVKGVKFEDIKEVADPVEMAEFYSAQGADELVFYDIAASVEGRGLFIELFKKVAAKVSIPLMAGGGIATISDIDHALSFGAAKVSINTGAIKNPDIINEAAVLYGSGCVTLSMDVKKVNNSYRVFKDAGRVDTGLDALEWARRGQENGAGELVVNSIDNDGVRGGFDLDLLKAVRSVCGLPIVASGGAGNRTHFLDLFTVTDIEAGLGASVFHYKDILIPELKAYLRENGIPVNLKSEGKKR